MADAVALESVDHFLISWQLSVQYRLCRHWYYVSAWQGKHVRQIRSNIQHL